MRTQSLIELVGNQLLIGLRLGLIEPGKNSARFHMHSVADRDFRHHPTGRMLYLLHIGLDHKCARQHHGARHRNHCEADAGDSGADDENPRRDLELSLVLAGDLVREIVRRVVVGVGDGKKPNKLSFQGLQ